MTLKDFIKENKEELDVCIRRALGGRKNTINNEDRRQWILNEETLYNWARREGVRI